MGTPLYMSPEQAREEASTELSDQYCLGATLFEMLTLRVPTWAEDGERFWEKKRAGVIDPLTREERAGVPPALALIALKAMAPAPGDRYREVDAMRRDLESYQAGLAVSAYRENPFQALARWVHANRRTVWVAGAALLVLALVAGAWWRDHLRERAAFREVYRDSLAGTTPAALSGRWRALSRAWMQPVPETVPMDDPRWIACAADGVTLHAYEGWAELAYGRHLLGNLRVEWDAEALDQPLNLNCFVGTRDRDHAYIFSIGGWDDPSNCVVTYGPELLELGHCSAEPLRTGRWYHFALDREDRRLRLWRDDVVLMDVRTPDDLVPGDQVFGFDTCNGNRVRVAHVAIQTQPLAQLISPLAVGDSLFRLENFGGAAERYQEIIDAYPGTGLEQEATYRLALCALRQGDSRRGLDLLDRFEHAAPGHPLAPYAWHERLRLAEARGDRQQADGLIARLAADADPALLRLVYSELVDLRRGVFDPRPVARPGDPPFPADTLTQAEAALVEIEGWGRQCRVPDHNADLVNRAARCLRFWDRDDLVLAHFPGSHQACALSLLNLGRYDELCRTYPLFTNQCAEALLAQDRADEVAAGDYPTPMKIRALAQAGRLDDALARYGADENCGWWLIVQGRAQEALDRYGRFHEIAAQALARLGRPQEGLALDPSPWTRANCLIGLGRYDEAMALVPVDTDVAWTAAIARRRDAETAQAALPDAARAVEQRLAAGEVDHDHDGPWFAGYVLPLFLAVHDGGGGGGDAGWQARCTAVMAAHRNACGQRLWHAMALLSGAEDDAAFLAQPSRHGAAAMADLLHGIRAECQGDPAGARASYAAALARKPWERDFTISADAFLAWRVAALAP
jgi:tetratricopeptide (TPR) repeat protein